jgi:hypothetical protein
MIIIIVVTVTLDYALNKFDRSVISKDRATQDVIYGFWNVFVKCLEMQHTAGAA